MARKQKYTGPITPAFVDLRAIALRANVSERTIRNWMSEGAISCIKIGRVIRFKPEVFDLEVSHHTTKASTRKN